MTKIASVPEIYWAIPTQADAGQPGASSGEPLPDFGYLTEVARTADTLGFDGVLIPASGNGLDSLTVASALSPQTRRVKLLAEVWPATISPSAAARFIATLDDISGGRAQFAIVAGGQASELQGDGVFLSSEERDEQAGEWLTVVQGLLRGDEVNYEGRYVKVKGGRHPFRPVQKPYPPIYYEGVSEKATGVAAKYADLYLVHGEPVSQLKVKLDAVREAAAREGRAIRLGARLSVVVRSTEEEARRAGESLSQAGAAALVGSPDQVAAAIQEYRALGMETFILSGHPHIQEAIYTAELLFPALGKASAVSASVPGSRAAGSR